MSTRISDPSRSFAPRLNPCLALAAGLLLAGCQVAVPNKAEQARKAAEQEALANAEGNIACARGDETAFAPICAIDRTQTQDGLFLTLRHPDGGFRRLLVTSDGRGVIAADGAEAAVVTLIGPSEIEVALGDARYRLPATVGPAARP